ncbi:M20 metallopeptidase family protein [Pseudotabrizicola algicola]|uniref:Amidohydrolase n=1 Tax=Pseudotabrizicola algicola TaxID=2709381 RepID=A0A6B3RTI9_9RHOB|nr:amidohydrolase [Pseudotabrizicola algicola]NEX48723.1 amidohydrolase [Pseudotabrizicola algicola]
MTIPFRQWYNTHQAQGLEWFQTLHAMPETGFSEHRTAAYVASVLRGLGLEVIAGLGGTGLVGLLRGARTDRTAPFIGLRAELDALPMAGPADGTVQTTEGPRYHGCGHDGHMATLLTAAAYLAAQPDLSVNVAFVFQPAEELLTGAAAMIADGLLDLVPLSAIFALHNIPGLPTGSAGVAEGAALASSDEIRVTLTAQGTHGSAPHTGQDAILAAAHFLVLCQQLLTRRTDSRDSAVLSFGQIEGGHAPNVLPDTVRIAGSLRSHSEKARAEVHDLLKAAGQSTTLAFGTPVAVKITAKVPVLMNDPGCAAIVRETMIRTLGADRLIANPRPVMASEDFALFRQHLPGAYIFVGQDGAYCHHPDYRFDTGIIPVGAAILVELALSAAGQPPIG